MLGEDHSLLSEFPEHGDVIHKLTQNDMSFASDVKEYDSLDREIRVLELRGSPIDDMAMCKLKQNRAVLKNSLYQRIVIK
ncbi:DUF465 domain-containing protein [Vibrio kasasachensis]|uniref:YdcH family protein n=1 Tax=Vibrio kasasachensis TaxID=2910248 RepID=UPI003D13BFE0